jgi:hypothetical protein
MELPFDILKKIDIVNFEWVEAVRDLQTAEARTQELQARSPDEYVVFSQRTQQIVGRFNSLMAGASDLKCLAQDWTTTIVRAQV